MLEYFNIVHSKNKSYALFLNAIGFQCGKRMTVEIRFVDKGGVP